MLGCDVRSEQFDRRGGHEAGPEPASRESENRHYFRGPGRGGLDAEASVRRSRVSRRTVLLPLGLGDGVSGESEISAETSFVYSVGSVLRV